MDKRLYRYEENNGQHHRPTWNHLDFFADVKSLSGGAIHVVSPLAACGRSRWRATLDS
jgi:hypothetical protein